MKPLGLFTIPHTGTRLFINDLFKDFEQLPFRSASASKNFKDIKYCLAHVLNEDMDNIEYFCEECSAVVVPLRHPRSVAKSWLLNNHVHVKEPDWCTENNLHQCWDNMINSIDRYNPFYICIDIPEIRDIQLQRLSEYIKFNLSTGWTPIGKSNFVEEESQNFKYQIPSEWLTFYEDKARIMQ